MHKPRILEDKPTYNPLKIIKFMASCHDIVSLDLVGMSLIVLSEEHRLNKTRVIALRPVFGEERTYTSSSYQTDEKGNDNLSNSISGVMWIDDFF
jgi:hypothetical protein